MNEQKQETRKDADTASRPPTNQIVLGDVEGSVMKKPGTVEYPELKGKVIEQVRYKNDPDFTVLVMQSFALEPEMSGNDAAGDIGNWKILKTRSLPPRFKQRE